MRPEAAHPVPKAPYLSADATEEDLADIRQSIAVRVVDLEGPNHIVGPWTYSQLTRPRTSDADPDDSQVMMMAIAMITIIPGTKPRVSRTAGYIKMSSVIFVPWSHGAQNPCFGAQAHQAQYTQPDLRLHFEYRGPDPS